MKLVFSFLMMVSFGAQAWAGALDGIFTPGGRGTGVINIRPALGNLFARSLPTTPLEKGLLEGKVAVGVFKMGQDKDGASIKQSLPGSGGALSLLYGFSKHWGVTAIAGFAGAKGDFQRINPYGNVGDIVSGKPEQKAVNAALNLVWDGFSGDNFRLPVMLGLSYLKYSESLSIPFTILQGPLINHRGVMSEDYSYDEFGYSLGLAPQFNTGQFRWVPFFFSTSAVNKGKRKYMERDLDTGQVYTATPNTEESGTVVTGIQVVYRPWNLSYSYISPSLSDVRPQDGNTMSSHTLTFSRKF